MNTNSSNKQPITNMIKKFSLAQFEEIIETLATHAPQLPRTIRSFLSRNTATGSLIAGIIIIILTAFSLLKVFIFPFTLIKDSPITANIYLFQAIALLIALILIISVKKLRQRKLKGWYNLLYTSILCAFISIGFFDPILIISTILIWYLLYQIKKDFV